MKRRSFLQAVGGAIAAVFAPLAVAEKQNRRPELEQLAAAFRETRRIQTRAWLNNDPRVPPETIAELRAAIESCYETVHEFKQTSYENTEPMISGFGLEPTPQPEDRYNGPFYGGFIIMGRGDNEREAVADAFKGIGQLLVGKEMMWRKELSFNKLRFFEENKTEFVVRGRVLVLR